MSSICVYCGSNPGSDPRYLEAAIRTGTLLGEGGHTLVYGGGKVGLMGALADAALQAGGCVIGVIPEHLDLLELGHPDLPRITPLDQTAPASSDPGVRNPQSANRHASALHVVGSMHERKLMMADLSDGFLALPGGIGTLEEIIEVFVWTQLGVHLKPCAVLNVGGFYDPLLDFLRGMTTGRFLRQEQFDQLIVESDPAEAIARLLTCHPTTFPKWEDRNIIHPTEADIRALE